MRDGVRSRAGAVGPGSPREFSTVSATRQSKLLHPRPASATDFPWPRAGGKTGALVRAFDWSTTPLGPISGWPQSLRTSVDIVLRSPVPMVMLWGADGIMIYNDAYAGFAGGRHPRLFGSKVIEGWPEVANFSRHVLDVGLRGETLSFREEHLILHRHGAPEDVWLDLDYSPILDESGRPAGVLAIVIESTERVHAEAALRGSEERLRLVADALPVLVSFVDRNETYRFANRYYLNWFGIAPDDIIGKTLRELLGETVYAHRKPYIDRALAGEHVAFESFTMRPDGTRRDSDIQYIPERDADGRIAGFHIFVVDITERKRNDMALRQLFEQAPSFMMILQGREHTFAFVNAAYQQLIGHRDVIGKPIREALPELEGQGFFELLDGVYATGEPYVGRAVSVQIQRTPHGPREQRFVDFVYHPIADENDVVTGVFVQGNDITERILAETALRELNETLERQVTERTAQLMASRAQIGTFFEHSSEFYAIIEATSDGHFRYVEINPATLRLYGRTREQVIGHTVEEVFGADGAAEIERHLGAALRSGEPYRYTRTHGDAIVEAVAAPIPGESGERRRLVVSARDVSEARSLEEQLRQAQKMEAVGQLTGGIAHDFNNLLQGIIGSLNVVEKRIGQGRIAEVAHFVGGAMTAANRAAALTHRLLAFSRRQPIDPKPIDANALIASMEDLLRRTTGETIRMEVRLAANLSLTRCDTNQLESAILNLVINARDAMPDGGALTIETFDIQLGPGGGARGRTVKPGPYICIAVKDTGTGMTPDIASRAFDPFFTTKPIGQGTGLGLSMVYGFARQSEGIAKIETTIGEGTTVKIYLPRHAGATEADEPAPGQPGEHAAQDGEVVLVVEDDGIVRALIVEVLDELGYRALEAADGPAALAILDSAPPIDLLVTDIGLPGLNGRQVADAARVRRPGLKTLFMTGYAETAATASGFLEPGMAMMTKPFAMDALAKRIREMIEG
jgi:PAS domain S-box-containing protein